MMVKADSKNFLAKEFTLRFRVTHLFLVSALFCWMLYFGWEFYWFTKVSWYFIKWHTHLAPYFFVYTALIALALFQKKTSNKLLGAFSLVTGFFIAEIFLLILFGTEQKYVEYICNPVNFYHVWPANQIHHIVKDEYDYIRHTNSLGFSDAEWSTEKKTSRRVLAIGDSFTEGDGAVVDSCYPVLLGKFLNSPNDSTGYEILNAGTCGSDPVYGYQNLQDRLCNYRPDVVLQTISSNDLLEDFKIRGGFERFQSNHQVKYKPTPWWFYPAEISNITGLVVNATHANELGPESVTPSYKKAIENIQRQIIHGFDSLATAHNFKVVIIVLPLKEEIARGNYFCDFSFIKNEIAKSNHVVCLDLLRPYENYIRQSGKDYKNLYWKKDSHPNADGYKMMAECIAAFLKTQQ